MLERIEAGEALAKAVTAVGFSRSTVSRAAARDAQFAAQLEAAVAVGAPQRETSTKFTAEVRAEYLALLRNGKRRGRAARALGLDPSTVRAYAAQHVEFRQERRAAEAEADEVVEDALFYAARNGNFRAIEFWLINRKPNVWRNVRLVGVVGPQPRNPVSVEVAVQDKTESTLRIGRALEQTGALGASVAAMLGRVLAEADARG